MKEGKILSLDIRIFEARRGEKVEPFPHCASLPPKQTHPPTLTNLSSVGGKEGEGKGGERGGGRSKRGREGGREGGVKRAGWILFWILLFFNSTEVPNEGKGEGDLPHCRRDEGSDGKGGAFSTNMRPSKTNNAPTQTHSPVLNTAPFPSVFAAVPTKQKRERSS